MTTYIIAEIGINHDGDFKKAQSLLQSAKLSGADAVKFQYRNLDRCYCSIKEIGDEILYAEIKKCSLRPKDYQDLYAEAKQLGLEVGLSFFLTEDLHDFPEEFLLNVDFFKVPSPEFQNYELINELLRLNKHVICSTGAHAQRHIDSFIAVFSEYTSQISLLHCVSNYPLHPYNSHLGYIKYLSRIWSGEVGYSSHDEDVSLCGIAVAYGASIIERHITLQKLSSGLDHSSSSDPVEFSEMTTHIRTVEKAISGDEPRVPNQGEILNLQNLGRSFYASKDLPAGYKIQRSDLLYRSPRVSISTDTIQQYLQLPLQKSLSSGTPLTASHFLAEDYDSSNIAKRLSTQYNSKILIPARYHDIHDLRSVLNHKAYELHLSYEESLRQIDLTCFRPYESYSIHIPDYIDPTTLIDPFSKDPQIKSRSLEIIDNLFDLASALSDLTNLSIPVVGSFSVHSDPLQFYDDIASICKKYSSPSSCLAIQILPPYAWYFGGSVKTNVFDSMHSFENIVLREIPVCLDLSHLIMSSNYYKFALLEAYSLLAPSIVHQHVAGASGIDGEGTSLATLNYDESNILSAMLSNSVYSVLEVWQGHLNQFAGFKQELLFLAK